MNQNYQQPEIQQKLPEIVTEMWRLSGTEQGGNYVSKQIKEHYGAPLLRLSQRVYTAYVESNGDPRALERLLDRFKKPSKQPTTVSHRVKNGVQTPPNASEGQKSSVNQASSASNQSSDASSTPSSTQNVNLLKYVTALTPEDAQ